MAFVRPPPPRRTYFAVALMARACAPHPTSMRSSLILAASALSCAPLARIRIAHNQTLTAPLPLPPLLPPLT